MKNTVVENSVSRETLERLRAYEASLHEWQKKFNLVSNASLEDAWNRHFLDSMQLFNFIPKTARSLCDFGSGAGFPGMVLAIMAKEKTPYLKVSLIESIKKKTLYLNEVNNITEANAVIINDRIENIPPQSFDVITSRAMASLKDLLSYTKKFFGKNTVCIFPKGKSYAEEIAEAEKFWKFDCKIVPSEMSSEGVILIITNLSAIKGVK